MRYAFAAVLLMVSVVAFLAIGDRSSVAAAEPAVVSPPRGTIVFSEDFEQFDKSHWNDISGDGSALKIVDGGRRGKCVQVTATLDKDTGGHLYKMLDNGMETCHLRFYVKFEAEHSYVHHFVTLCGYNPPTRWPQGGAGEKPRGDERFSTGIEPWGDWGKHEPPGIWNFYSYWCEMEKSRDGKYWGNSFVPEGPVKVTRDKWICVEIMLKCNTVGKADGEQAVWIDGKEVGRWKDIRWRTDEKLKVNGVWIMDYITEQSSRHNGVKEPRKVNRLWFDEIVVSDQYIGPIAD